VIRQGFCYHQCRNHGTVVVTPDLWGQAAADYSFGYWDLDGARQQDAYGIAFGSFSFIVTTSTVATAHFYPTTQDLDADGAPDWFEYVYYPSLDQAGLRIRTATGSRSCKSWRRTRCPPSKTKFCRAEFPRPEARSSDRF